MGQQRIALPLDESMFFLIDTFVLAASDLIKGVCQMTHDVKLVIDNLCVGSMTSVALRNGFHISMTASSMVLQRSGPIVSKNSCMSCPPSQIGRLWSRSATTMAYVWPLWMDISSTPMVRS